MPPADSQIFLYAGDEIEVSSSSLTYESVKHLRCLSHPSIARPIALVIAATLRTNNPSIEASLGIFLDDAPNPSAEATTKQQQMKLITKQIQVPAWAHPTVHKVELKLKTGSPPGIAYNDFFELYYKL